MASSGFESALTNSLTNQSESFPILPQIRDLLDEPMSIARDQSDG